MNLSLIASKQTLVWYEQLCVVVELELSNSHRYRSPFCTRRAYQAFFIIDAIYIHQKSITIIVIPPGKPCLMSVFCNVR